MARIDQGSEALGVRLCYVVLASQKWSLVLFLLFQAKTDTSEDDEILAELQRKQAELRAVVRFTSHSTHTRTHARTHTHTHAHTHTHRVSTILPSARPSSL